MALLEMQYLHTNNIESKNTHLKIFSIGGLNKKFF